MSELRIALPKRGREFSRFLIFSSKFISESIPVYNKAVAHTADLDRASRSSVNPLKGDDASERRSKRLSPRSTTDVTCGLLNPESAESISIATYCNAILYFYGSR